MQTVFERQARDIDVEQALQKNIAELTRDGEVDADFAMSLLTGVECEKEALKTTVESAAPQWSWERMDAISRAILLVGAYEIVHCKDVPPAVVMNEAIEIAKEYGTEESKKFVNGVLNALAHRS